MVMKADLDFFKIFEQTNIDFWPQLHGLLEKSKNAGKRSSSTERNTTLHPDVLRLRTVLTVGLCLSLVPWLGCSFFFSQTQTPIYAVGSILLLLVLCVLLDVDTLFISSYFNWCLCGFVLGPDLIIFTSISGYSFPPLPVAFCTLSLIAIQSLEKNIMFGRGSVEMRETLNKMD